MVDIVPLSFTTGDEFKSPLFHSLAHECFFHKLCLYPGGSVYLETDPPFDPARRVDSPTPNR